MTEIGPDEERRVYLRQEYISRINRVIDYIENHIDQNLSLEILSAVANFSRFHFHRLFRALVGETLNSFNQRNRIEKTASQLLDNPKKSITEIAFNCGFSGSASFARAFKETFQMSASEWRADGHLRHSKIRKTKSKYDQLIGKNRKDFDISSRYIDDQTQNPNWRIKMKGQEQIQVEVKDMQELYAAYVRHIGPYKGDSELLRSQRAP
ncbi:MAG: helix-turn-helix transcriptional regulator [bacterium]|nr:helix-turn-helix transcriptional regulator [bacterium]